MSAGQRLQYSIFVLFFTVSVWYFWSWWFKPGHKGDTVLYFLMTIGLAYQFTLLPVFYTFFLGWMKKPVERIPKLGLKVAMVTLTVPGSESLSLVEQQLKAMKNVKYPHDSWILVDKDHSEEIKELARKYEVNYFSRHDVGKWGQERVEKWNSKEPPYKEKTKAGNINAWLDMIYIQGIEYEFFTQLDIDHNPKPNYLDRVLGHFKDPLIAWVQAPSVYDNFEYWTAKGSAEQELVLQGPLQSGFFGWSGTPFIIGSHSTYRMEAIRRIGGFQPTRAEDHLDTVVLSSLGYRGVYVPEIIAYGDGPENFEMYLGQQFAWAYSMMQVLFQYTPKLVLDYTFRQAGQFLFAQTWYIAWSTTMGILFVLPSIALLTDKSISRVGYLDFIQHSLPQASIILMIWFWSRKWFQPKGLTLSWRGIILHIARWPIVLSALVQVILRIEKPYMITRKGVDLGESKPFYLKTHIPYFMLIALPLTVCGSYLLTTSRSHTQGYLLFALQGAVGVYLVYTTALLKDIKDLIREVGFGKGISLRRSAISLCFVFTIGISVVSCASADRIKEAVTATVDSTVVAPELTEDQSSENTKVIASPEATETSELDEPTLTVTSTEETSQNSPTETSSPTSSAIVQPTETATEVTPIVNLPENRLFLGVYDVWTKGFELTDLDAEINYFDWVDPESMNEFIVDSLRKQRVPVISIEPFTTFSGNPDNLIQDTLYGLNDEVIRENASVMRNHNNQPILVRFAHEMELVGNYPWSIEDSESWIEFYRHFINIFDEEGIKNVLWIWSPAGNEESSEYYPGDEYVDYVGLTVLGNKDWDLQYGDYVNSFEDLFAEKYNRVAQFEKPVIIAELGVAGETDHKSSWLSDAYEVLDDYPLLEGVIYFNSLNAENAWMGDTPDWRISPDMLWEREDMPQQ